MKGETEHKKSFYDGKLNLQLQWMCVNSIVLNKHISTKLSSTWCNLLRRGNRVMFCPKSSVSRCKSLHSLQIATSPSGFIWGRTQLASCYSATTS